MSVNVQSIVKDFLEGKDVGAAGEIIKEEWFRLEVREELQKLKAGKQWKMKMKDIVYGGCNLNGD